MLKGYAFGLVTDDCIFTEEGYFVWCGSVFRRDDRWYMLYSRWRREDGFDAWVTKSEICLAKSDALFGRFRHVKVVKTRGTCTGWHRDTGHNPAAFVQGGRVYMYYSASYGDGTYWDHRNRQRVGLGWADDPEGDWTFCDEPAVDVSPAGFDSLMTSNPAVCACPDGRILMVYKAVENSGELPKGGPVICGTAFAGSPAGPFVKTGIPAFRNPTDPWSVEDPFVWHEGGRFRAVCSDFHGYFTGTGDLSLGLFTSPDGVHWSPDPETPLLTRREFLTPEGLRRVRRLERPQLVFRWGRPVCLVCACAEDDGFRSVYNVRIPIVTA